MGAGKIEPVFEIDIADFCPPLEIHSILYKYPVQSRERFTLRKPKSDDACSRLAKSVAKILTGIDGYVCELNPISNVPVAASDAVAKRVMVALYSGKKN